MKSILQMDFKLPSTLGNKSFRGVMNGLVNIDANYQYKLPKGLLFGAGFSYAYFDVNGNVFQANVIGRLEVLGPYARLGYRKSLSETMFLETSLNAGYAYAFTTSNQSDAPYNQKGLELEPKVGFYVLSSEILSFGLVVTYNNLNFQFTPDNLYLDYFPGITEEYSVGNTSYFSIGFGFTTYLVKTAD